MKIYVFLSLISVCFFNYAHAVELPGELSAESEAVYEGYAYAAYSMDVLGTAPLSVQIDSSRSGHILIAQLPDKSFYKNGQLLKSANIKKNAPFPGKWTFIITSYFREESDNFDITVEGAENVKQIPTNQLDKKLLEEAFAYRGIYSKAKLLEKEKQERLHKIDLMSEKLTLPSYRSQVFDNLNKSIKNEEESYNRESERFNTLKIRITELERAMSDVIKIELSQKVIQDLLNEAIEGVSRDIQRTSKSLSEQSARLTAFKIAREEMQNLKTVSIQLENKSRELFNVTPRNYTEFSKLKKEFLHYQERRNSLAKDVAKKLIDSSFDSYLRLSWRIPFSESRSPSLASEGGMFWGFYIGQALASNLIYDAIDSGIDNEMINQDVWFSNKIMPWPPPPPSSQVVLDDYFNGWRQRFKSLGDVNLLVIRAAYATNYQSLRYFGVPGGFASVAQLEQIDGNGVPLDKDARWSTEPIDMKRFSIGEYLKALLTAQPGYYRVVAFIVSSNPFSPSTKRAKFSDLQKWGTSGLNSLPESVSKTPYSKEHKTTVLVYEFLKRKQSDEPKTSIPGRHTAQEHLKRTHLLSYLQ